MTQILKNTKLKLIDILRVSGPVLFPNHFGSNSSIHIIGICDERGGYYHGLVSFLCYHSRIPYKPNHNYVEIN